MVEYIGSGPYSINTTWSKKLKYTHDTSTGVRVWTSRNGIIYWAVRSPVVSRSWITYNPRISYSKLGNTILGQIYRKLGTIFFRAYVAMHKLLRPRIPIYIPYIFDYKNLIFDEALHMHVACSQKWGCKYRLPIGWSAQNHVMLVRGSPL